MKRRQRLRPTIREERAPERDILFYGQSMVARTSPARDAIYDMEPRLLILESVFLTGLFSTVGNRFESIGWPTFRYRISSFVGGYSRGFPAFQYKPVTRGLSRMSHADVAWNRDNPHPRARPNPFRGFKGPKVGTLPKPRPRSLIPPIRIIAASGSRIPPVGADSKLKVVTRRPGLGNSLPPRPPKSSSKRRSFQLPREGDLSSG